MDYVWRVVIEGNGTNIHFKKKTAFFNRIIVIATLILAISSLEGLSNGPTCISKGITSL